jgi:hypothetical protein
MHHSYLHQHILQIGVSLCNIILGKVFFINRLNSLENEGKTLTKLCSKLFIIFITKLINSNKCRSMSMQCSFPITQTRQYKGPEYRYSHNNMHQLLYSSLTIDSHKEIAPASILTLHFHPEDKPWEEKIALHKMRVFS